ncbi:DGQHR domain-containing protein [Paenibacillus larvae]
MSIMEKLVSKKEINGLRRKRSQIYTFEKFEPELRSKREEEGWQFDKTLKNSVRMRKNKPMDEQFEDEVWNLFASLGFTYMNKDRNLQIRYGSTGKGTTKQIDVFAVDDETILFVECKYSPIGKKGDFKKEIESINGIRTGLFAEAKTTFPNRKTKYIFATKNYEVPDNDRIRMKDLGIYHFDENAISYFTELAKHLGECARFQLLGNLFEGQKIGSMENKIPAIEGKMGGNTYYSFSIEPEKLLKIAYVLHRNEANGDMMPTYQRIIKKNRLREIQKFVDKGGFFPNSLIISIDTKGKKLNFDIASLQGDNSISRIGILHLPQLYRSAYIIDGQHRLYGYANSIYAGINSIPVVAFVNLAQEKQVELFMEINENQKSVSKNLQNTLNADLLWSCDDWNKRRKALRLNIAQKLGELQSSPLFGRIVIGENEISSTCCITIDTIEKSLKSTNFLSRYSKGNVIVEDGTFDKGKNEATSKILIPFITESFNYFKENLPGEWEKGGQGVLTINNSVQAIIRILNDIVNHLITLNKINPKTDNPNAVARNVQYYLAPLVNFLNRITEDERKELRTNYGQGGRTKVWRTFQKLIAEERPDFQPEGLNQWIRDNTRQYNVASFEIIHDLESLIKQDFAIKLKSKYGVKWITAGIPPKVYRKANKTMGEQNYNNSVNGVNKTVSIWDCVTITDCRDIAIFGCNWKDLFETSYTRPEEKRLSGGKVAKTEWINRLAGIADKNSTNYSVSEKQYLFLKELNDWLVGNKVLS